MQIFLPLNEVAIGTAAAVAFQSLGSAIFVFVRNMIPQNTLQDVVDSGELPGIIIAFVITAGASGRRNVVGADALPVWLEVYNSALEKVFIASIPMCGLACGASCFMEWRNVKDKRKVDYEDAIQVAKHRTDLEKKISESHRKSTMSGYSTSG